MTLLLDTSGLLAAIDAGQRSHAACAAAIEKAKGPFALSPFVLAELDYLLGTKVGAAAQRALLDEVAKGAYRLEPFDAGDVARASKVMDRYSDLHVGLADASIVVLAARLGTRDVLTLDRRHFRAMRRLDGKPFRVLPDDLR